MKRADLKAGETYAVRRQYRPCVLLSTDVYRRQQFTWSSKPDDYAIAPAGTKPGASKSFASPTCYGFITLSGDADTLAGLDVAATLAAILADGSAGRPQDTSIEFVTSTSAFLGRYAEHEAAERERREATQARWRIEESQRAAAHARHDAVARRLNTALGEDALRRSSESSPTHVSIPLAQAEALAELLEILRPTNDDKEN